MQGWRSIWAAFFQIKAEARPRRRFCAISISIYHMFRISKRAIDSRVNYWTSPRVAVSVLIRLENRLSGNKGVIVYGLKSSSSGAQCLPKRLRALGATRGFCLFLV